MKKLRACFTVHPDCNWNVRHVIREIFNISSHFNCNTSDVNIKELKMLQDRAYKMCEIFEKIYTNVKSSDLYCFMNEGEKYDFDKKKYSALLKGLIKMDKKYLKTLDSIMDLKVAEFLRNCYEENIKELRAIK